MRQEKAAMATGATLHLEGMRCGSPVLGLPVLPQSHWFSDRLRGQQATPHLSLSLCVTGERSHHAMGKVLLLVHHCISLHLPASTLAQTGL